MSEPRTPATYAELVEMIRALDALPPRRTEPVKLTRDQLAALPRRSPRDSRPAVAGATRTRHHGATVATRPPG